MIDQDPMSAVDAELEKLRTALRSRGIAERVGFGSSPAVLVVDYIKGFTDITSPLAADFTAELTVTRTLLDAARDTQIPVVLSTSVYDEQLREAGVWSSKIPSAKWLTAGTPWVEMDPRLGQEKTDSVLVKKYASCFFGTDLISRLTSQGVDTLIITGCTTSGCVRATAVDSCSFGLRTIVVEDAVGDRAPVSHKVALFDIDAKYGDVVASETVTQYLRKVH